MAGFFRGRNWRGACSVLIFMYFGRGGHLGCMDGASTDFYAFYDLDLYDGRQATTNKLGMKRYLATHGSRIQ